MTLPHILVVDSSLSVRVNLQHALMAAGFSVTACESGAAARKAMRRQPFSMMILEAILPDNEGAALIREMRSTGLGGKMPVAMISSDCSVAARLKGLGAGAVDYIGKPVGSAFVAKRVRHILDRPTIAGGFASHNPARILLVDDSETFLNAFADRLRAEGHDVVLAKSGAEALSFLDAQVVDGIVLDLFMPGLSGLETCRRIRNSPQGGSVPIMLLTGREDGVARATGFSAGVDDYMVKSTDVTAMAVRLGDLLRKKPAERGSNRPTPKSMSGLRGPDGGSSPPSSGGPDSPRSAARLSALLAMASVSESQPPPEPSPQERERVTSAPPPPPSSNDAARSTEVPASGPYDSPLFEQVLKISGLQNLIGRGCLRRAFERAGIDPRALTADGLDKAMPEIRQTLAVFLPKEEADRHALAISSLLRKLSHSAWSFQGLREIG